ncbi:MAG: pantoate--beta-alanine ligase [Gemmatimonadaceae bacterium]|nr:pantoate--beta-alanine ligase [Gemmatimonadaceae bacterium]
MLTARTRRELRSILVGATGDGERVGLVATMGALHEGHLHLVDTVRAKSDIVVMSVYVNPLQFGPNEDFSRYPRNLDEDSAMAAERGVDVLFAPADAEMYSAKPMVTVSVGDVGAAWEGKTRPGHFNGVATVVAKLFNIVRPDVAAFGQKDLQQVAVIRAMVGELNFPVEMVVMPTVRESDGLALSSRNRYLDETQRKAALVLSRALDTMTLLFKEGNANAEMLVAAGKRVFADVPSAVLDYLAVVDPRTFNAKTQVEPGDAVIVAAKVGSTRLIDNVILTQ